MVKTRINLVRSTSRKRQSAFFLFVNNPIFASRNMESTLVGFYSPKAKSGVTELSLAIYQWLKMNTNLSVAFISYGTLELILKKQCSLKSLLCYEKLWDNDTRMHFKTNFHFSWKHPLLRF